MPNVHYTISPSQLHRWLACEASFKEEQRYPPSPGGPAAVDGTHTHTLIEHCLKKDTFDAMFMLDEELEDHEGKFTVDLERVIRANVCLHYVRDRKQQLGLCSVRAEEPSDPGESIGWDDWRGTCDVTLVSKDTLEVIDYKDGRTAQDVVDNPQLLSYLLGRILEYRDTTFDTLRMTIVQPRCNPSISHHDVTRERVMAFAEQVKEWRERVEGDTGSFTPGEKQCRYCRAKGNCTALQMQALGNVAIGFQAIEVAQQAADKEPSQMSDEQLREFIEGIPLLKQAIVAAEEEALRRFESGHKVVGLKAVRGRGSRNWAYNDEEMTEKLKRFGIPKSSLFVTKLVSPAQVEKLHWKKRDGTKKVLSKRQLETLEKDYIKRTPGKLTVVPESDDREEVVIGAQALFTPVTNEMPDWMAL